MWWWSGEAVPLGGGREGVERYVCAASDAGERVDDDGECVWVVAGGSGGVVGRDNWEQERAAGLAASSGLGAGVEQGPLVWVSSCAIVFGYDRRGGSEGDRWVRRPVRIASARKGVTTIGLWYDLIDGLEEKGTTVMERVPVRLTQQQGDEQASLHFRA